MTTEKLWKSVEGDGVPEDGKLYDIWHGLLEMRLVDFQYRSSGKCFHYYDKFQGRITEIYSQEDITHYLEITPPEGDGKKT